jgi:hypothetical protein
MNRLQRRRSSWRLPWVRLHELAADLPVELAALMAQSQVFNTANKLKTVITTTRARSKPSWMVVATKDRNINPDLEQWIATRAGSHTIEVAGASHSIYVSRS